MREIGWRAFAGSKPKHLLPLAALFRRSNLVCCNRIGFTIAARDFSRRRGASDEHIPKWICKERATKSARKRTAARRVAPNLACGFVARRSQPHWRGMLPPRASPQAKLGATNVTIFTLVTTKPAARAVSRQTKPAMFIVPKLAAKSDSFAALG